MTRTRLLLVVTLALLLTGLACATVLPPRDGLGPAAGPGGALTRDDWIAHLPLACGATLLVVVVDALFIARIIVDRSRRRAATRSR